MTDEIMMDGEPLEVGDGVYCLLNGKGKVESIDSKAKFPIEVAFSHGYCTYTKTFKGWANHENRTLYWQKPEIIPPPKRKKKVKVKKYPWYCAIEGDIDISYYTAPTEVEAILDAHNILDEEYTVGQKVKFKIGKCSHPVDSVGNCGEDAFLNMLEKCGDEMRSADRASFDMSPSDIAALGRVIKDFIRGNSKVDIWYCNDPHAKDYAYTVGETK